MILTIAGLILGLLGIGPLISKAFEAFVVRPWILHTWSRERVNSELEILVCENTRRLMKPRNAATFGPPLQLCYFIDFLSATTNAKDRRILDRCFARWMTLSLKSKPTKLAVPKLGNVLFAEGVAKRLNVPLVIVRQEQSEVGAFHGGISNGDKVILVDDIASDPEFLNRCVAPIAATGAQVEGIMVLVDRMEGNCPRFFEKIDIPFSSIKSYDDRSLQEILHKVRTPFTMPLITDQSSGPLQAPTRPGLHNEVQNEE